MNKREAEVGFNLIFTLVLGLAAISFAIFLYLRIFGEAGDIPGKLDIDITVIQAKCNGLISSSSGGYCTDRIEIEDDNYINCPYARSNFGAIFEGTPPDCNGAERFICNKLLTEQGDKFKFDDVKVNNILCSLVLLCKDFQGRPGTRDECGGNIIKGKFSDVGKDQFCCSERVCADLPGDTGPGVIGPIPGKTFTGDECYSANGKEGAIVYGAFKDIDTLNGELCCKFNPQGQ